MKPFRHLIAAALLLCCPSLFAQITFSNANTQLNYPNSFSGVAIAVADMNADGYDDIIHLRNGRILTIELQLPSGGLQTIVVGQISNNSQWSMCVADADNNGFNDVLAGGSYDGVKLIRASANGQTYTTGNLPGTNIFLQGSNFVDINNDGWLDVFACHDDGNNRIWANDGTGQFVPANDWIDMTTVPPSDNSGNYGSVWTDFDNDGDIDLYIAKCRTGVNNPNDGRRINQLFVNNGDGTFFQDTLDVFGLRNGAQSWTADFGDVNNDGWMDCFITNHDAPSQLLLNNGAGVFTDVTAGSGIAVQGLPIQGIFRDFDNDGWLDIIVAGTRHHLYRNNGDGTFTDFGLEAFGTQQMESYAVGDLNHDGKLDVYGGYAQVYTTPSNIPDVIWLNNTQHDNNFLTVRLTGTTSNRNAIGARIEAWGPWGIQIREVRSGESYGIMNSMYQHFGLGTATGVDSLVIRWPSGLREVFHSIPANQSIQITEGTCISPFASLSVNGPLVFCIGESSTLSVQGGSTFAWSDGSSASTLTVTASGTYSVVVGDTSACTTLLPSVQFLVDPVGTPVIQVIGDTIFCPGGSVTLIASNANAYAWSNGESNQSIVVSSSGTYTVAVPGLCRDFASEPIQITLLDAPGPNVSNDTLTAAGPATLLASGSMPRWYANPFGDSPIHIGDTLNISMLTATDTFYVDNVTIYPGDTLFAGPFQHSGSSAYSGNNTNGQIIFDAFRPFTLRTVKVFTDTPGLRTIELRDGNVVLASLQVNIPTGESIVPLNFNVPAGENLILTTNAAQNQTSFGFSGPRLRRNSSGVQYPYTVPNVLSLKNSNFGTDVYYYFYHWDIKLPDTECVSDRVPVYAVLLINSSSQEAMNDIKLRLSPNPAAGVSILSLDAPLSSTATISLYDLKGLLISRSFMATGQQVHYLDLEHVIRGTYILVVDSGARRWHQTLIKQ